MNWALLDHPFWQTFFTAAALIAAYAIGRKQNEINDSIHRIQDTVELYGSYLIITDKDGQNSFPFIHIQNVGTRLIYLDKYIFNGKVYVTDGQILPPTYSQAINNFYRIELPTNQETHASLEVFYHDLENRTWSSMLLADKTKVGWDVKTLPRKAT